MKKRTLLLGFFFLLTTTLSCFSQQKIIGGSNVDISERPFQAAVFIDGTINGSFGAGVIINKRWLVTAGHVASVMSTSTSRIKVGATNIATGGLSYGVERIIIHPNYYTSHGRAFNDIALIKLSSDLTFSDKVQPILLNTAQNVSRGTEGVASGWGRISKDHTNLNLTQLKKALVTIKESNAGIILGEISQNTPYNGDSGGPLTIENSGNIWLAGLVSGGDGNRPTSVNTVYTNTGYYYPWITSQTQDIQPYSITGPNSICGTGEFTLPFDNATIELSPNISLVSRNGRTITISKKYDGSGNINVTNIGSVVCSKSFWVGNPIVTSIYYDGSNLHPIVMGGSSQINYISCNVGGNQYSTYGSFISIPGLSGNKHVRIKVANGCGYSQEYETDYDFGNGLFFQSIVNDNVSKSIKIEIAQDNELDIDYSFTDIKSGKTLLKGTINKNQTIDYSSLPAGIYGLELRSGNCKESIKIQIK